MNNQTLMQYMTNGIERIIKDILKSTLKNPKETAFLAAYTKAMKKNEERRKYWESQGEHIPGFLISSITQDCNLFCKGCYARTNGICKDNHEQESMSAEEWDKVFTQCLDLGIGFHLLAGGEPMLRRDVLAKAAAYKGIIFPVFTNGTLMDEDALGFFDQNRNMVPILSIEGAKEKTDARRGHGVYDAIKAGAMALKKRNIIFGASITITKENQEEVTSKAFIDALKESHCKAVLFIEYVPVDGKTQELALEEKNRQALAKTQEALRKDYKGMVFLSFPGDEEYMGGCLAAGRGFFHIAPDGKAEACPFSPYGDCNVKTQSLRQALKSPFFEKLKAQHLVGGEHQGGCALFAQEEKVKELLEKQ